MDSRFPYNLPSPCLRVYEIRDQDDVAFFHRTAEQPVEKQCLGCRRIVKVLPRYGHCGHCASRLEQGLDLE